MLAAFPTKYMAKKEQKVSVYVSLDGSQFPVHIYFNRFACDSVDGQLLLRFGLASPDGVLAHFATLIEMDAIEQSRESMLKFLDVLGGAPSEPMESWRSTASIDQVPCSNMMLASRTGAVGELRFGIYSHGAALEHSKKASGTSTITGAPVALLHCSLDLIRHVLTTVYLQTTS